MLDEPIRRARIVTAFFAVAFIVLSPLPLLVRLYPASAAELITSVPVALFLILLLIHTYHAIRCFTTIIPKRLRSPKVIDALIVLTYVALPVSWWYGPIFYLSASFLFAVASLKYATILGKTDGETLVRKKLVVDIIGILGCLIAFIVSAFGHRFAADWIFTLGFAAATVYLFYIAPLYVLPSEHRQAEHRPS